MTTRQCSVLAARARTRRRLFRQSSAEPFAQPPAILRHLPNSSTLPTSITPTPLTTPQLPSPLPTPPSPLTLQADTSAPGGAPMVSPVPEVRFR
jgi:hypothetical protein